MRKFTFEEAKRGIQEAQKRVLRVLEELNRYFVDKQDIIELMVISTIAQEPLLIVGEPGTAKSDLIIKFCEALGLQGNDYFEYMLTKFTEPNEILGPIDINKLKEGQYIRRSEGKLPTCRIAFLDEIFKSNSAILNTLLTILNERKFYQDGKPHPVNLMMLFAATNTIPEFSELDALKDRFIFKIESRPVKEEHFDILVEKGMMLEMYRSFNHKPWANLATLEDFQQIRDYLDYIFSGKASSNNDIDLTYTDPIRRDRVHYFGEETFRQFRNILY